MPGGKSAFEATVTLVVATVHTDEGIIGIGETYLDDPSGHKTQTAAKGMEVVSDRF